MITNFENFGGYIFCYESGFFRYKRVDLESGTYPTPFDRSFLGRVIFYLGRKITYYLKVKFYPAIYKDGNFLPDHFFNDIIIILVRYSIDNIWDAICYGIICLDDINLSDSKKIHFFYGIIIIIWKFNINYVICWV